MSTKKTYSHGMAAHGPRLDFTEADITQREDAERLEERAGNILQRKRQRSFAGVASDLSRLIDQQEARVVLPIVFDPCQQNASAILRRG